MCRKPDYVAERYRGSSAGAEGEQRAGPAEAPQPITRGTGYGAAQARDGKIACLAKEGTHALAPVPARKSAEAPAVERENDHTLPGNPHRLGEVTIRVGRELQRCDEGNQVKRTSSEGQGMAVGPDRFSFPVSCFPFPVFCFLPVWFRLARVRTRVLFTTRSSQSTIAITGRRVK
jgi:hypothetical protein